METAVIGSHAYKIVSVNTVVLGAGAAALNAADRLFDYGQKDLCLVCESMQQSTSRNTGSDKQTYYKLTLSGGDPDSVRDLAQTLFNGQCVDGDHALAEAALSAPCFLKLAEMGVPFPVNRFGEYIGYKTDHDPRRRATSAGPLTSKIMTECLERAVGQKGIRIYEHCQAVSLIVSDGTLMGVLCIMTHPEAEWILFNCKHLVFATGGPAYVYADSVYPVGHFGATGLAFQAGAHGKNLTEWQFGLASVAPRWNVSGTYMQVLPRVVSSDGQGGDEREFLNDFFAEPGQLLTNLFLKGYEWPFDVRKATGGSSIIDILVYIETALKGRRVFLDYRRNPVRGTLDPDMLGAEARAYLERAGACFGSPVERLLHMNEPAYAFFLHKGVDLKKQPLEIALCAQHNNGGLDIDCWWQTNIRGMFAAGEAAASHGVYRPGGSALNAGQVGSARAARYIASRGAGRTPLPEFIAAAQRYVAEAEHLASRVVGGNTADALWARAQKRMNRVGGAIRSAREIRAAIAEIRGELAAFERDVRVPLRKDIGRAFRLREMLVCQWVYLDAMADYADQGGNSRGSALYSVKEGTKPLEALDERFRHVVDDGGLAHRVQIMRYADDGCVSHWRDVRDIPSDDDFFENVWRDYRKDGNIR